MNFSLGQCQAGWLELGEDELLEAVEAVVHPLHVRAEVGEGGLVLEDGKLALVPPVHAPARRRLATSHMSRSPRLTQ